MQQLLIREIIDFEGENYFSVFANDHEQAYCLVKKHPRYIGGQLDHTIMKKCTKKVKQNRITKHFFIGFWDTALT